MLGVQNYIAAHIGAQHPVTFLLGARRSQEEKSNLAKLMVPKLVDANQHMVKHLTTESDPARATQDAGTRGARTR